MRRPATSTLRVAKPHDATSRGPSLITNSETFSWSRTCANAFGPRSPTTSQSPSSSGAFAQRSAKPSLSSMVASRPRSGPKVSRSCHSMRRSMRSSGISQLRKRSRAAFDMPARSPRRSISFDQPCRSAAANSSAVGWTSALTGRMIPGCALRRDPAVHTELPGRPLGSRPFGRGSLSLEGWSGAGARVWARAAPSTSPRRLILRSGLPHLTTSIP